MSRKIYAFAILIGTLGFFVLGYLYFFVYYTANLTINSNVENYTVELFSPATAQRWTHECPEKECFISDVAPFDYNIFITKPEYENMVMGVKIQPRRTQELVIEMKKRVRLEPLIPVNQATETRQQTIQRLRDEKKYAAVFDLGEGRYIKFLQNAEMFQGEYHSNNALQTIGDFLDIRVSELEVQSIYSSENIFISAGEKKYIFDTTLFRLELLPEIQDIGYIKYDIFRAEYLIKTQVGVFVYDQARRTYEYQYLFRDYVDTPEYTIGIIFSDERQKKKNFSLTESGNLIVRYSPEDKTREVIYSSSDPIDSIFMREGKVFFGINNSEYELINFD